MTKYSNTYINITFKTNTDAQNVRYVNGNDKNFKTAFTKLFTIRNNIANNINVKKTSYSVASIQNQSVYWCKTNKNIPYISILNNKLFNTLNNRFHIDKELHVNTIYTNIYYHFKIFCLSLSTHQLNHQNHLSFNLTNTDVSHFWELKLARH